MRKPLFIARQGRRPSGLFGHLVARIMAVETAAENVRALDLLELAPGDRMLEIGCGHGRSLADAVARANGVQATGLDASEVMLAVARRRNRGLIAGGRVRLDHGDSARLPYPDDAFTAALSVHTVYFWDAPGVHLAELFRVLAPGGRLVLGYRPGDDPGFADQVPPEIYRLHSVAQVENAAAAAGFAAIRTQIAGIRGIRMAWTIAARPRSAGDTVPREPPETAGTLPATIVSHSETKTVQPADSAHG